MEAKHALAITDAARLFVEHPDAFDLNDERVSHILFSIRPNLNKNGEERRWTFTVDLASDQVKQIVSYAAANATAQEQINFYHTISKEPMFNTYAGQLFKRFVLTWLSSNHLAVASLSCTPTQAPTRFTHKLKNKFCSPSLQIPTCRAEQTICGSLKVLKNATVDRLPFCFLPGSKSLAAIDAIVITDKSIITIQATNLCKPSTVERGFTDIKENLPNIPKWGKTKKLAQMEWHHVFITDNKGKARSLQGQMLSGPLAHICIYFAVFSVGGFDISSTRMQQLDEEMVSLSSRDAGVQTQTGPQVWFRVQFSEILNFCAGPVWGSPWARPVVDLVQTRPDLKLNYWLAGTIFKFVHKQSILSLTEGTLYSFLVSTRAMKTLKSTTKTGC